MKKILLLLLFPIAITLSGCGEITKGLYAFDERATAPIDSKEFKAFCADRGLLKQTSGLVLDTLTYTLGQVDEIVNTREVAENNPLTQSYNRKCEEVE